VWLDRLTDKAQLHLKMSLEADPADSQGASLILARLGGPVPPRASDALLQRLYSERSSKWDEGVPAARGYQGAALVADALLNVMKVQGDILDIGCGTGLVGERVRSRARVLHGIDISKSMIARAKEKQVYDELHVTDLMEFLATRRSTYDAITAAAVLVHFGELIGVLKAVSGALRLNGLFVFTVFADDEASNGFSVGPLELAAGAATCIASHISPRLRSIRDLRSRASTEKFTNTLRTNRSLLLSLWQENVVPLWVAQSDIEPRTVTMSGCAT
jgi:predicted TPR repeat methyltransferase